ncbi:MAG TPA: hypothetical protein VH643_23070 [Gemmataceae bacterium]
MTEEEWLSYSDPEEMLVFLRRKASDRKIRLFVCAWCRRHFWKQLHHATPRHLLEISERYADGLYSRKVVVAARNAFNRVSDRLCHAGTSRAIKAVWWAAYAHPINSAFQMRGRQPRHATLRLQAVLLRDIFNPFRAAPISSAMLFWQDSTVVRLAQAAYDERILPAGTLDNARLAVLADALEEAGCTDEQILTHLRGGGEHYRGCFVVDALLGKS